MLESTRTTVATEIETFYLTGVGASFKLNPSWNIITSELPRHYTFQFFFLLWLLLLGFQHLFLFQTDNDEPQSLALIPHSLSIDDVIMVLCTAKPLYYKGPILYSKFSGPSVWKFKYFGFFWNKGNVFSYMSLYYQ